MDVLVALTQRPVIVGLAIAGAMLVMASGLIAGKDATRPDRRATALSKTGYAVTFISIVLFIVAGFLSGR